MASKKLQSVVEILQTRIRHGDYSLHDIPPERVLATEVGVSHMTARKAVTHLLEQGILERQANGRLVVSSRGQRGGALQIAMLTQQLGSPELEQWRVALMQATEQRKWIFRPVLYMHWDDPTVSATLEGFDGVFFHPDASQPVPESLLQRIAKVPTVMLDQDLSAEGVPSISLFPTRCAYPLLDHLLKLGHETIDCLNVMWPTSVIDRRIASWRLWTETHGVRGSHIDGFAPCAGVRFDLGYRAMRERIIAGKLTATAIYCTTASAAIGAMRAFREHGIRIGTDVSVCCVNDEGFAQYTDPTLTSVSRPDASQLIHRALDWMGSRKPWAGPALLEPDTIPIFKGGSTANHAAGRLDR